MTNAASHHAVCPSRVRLSARRAVLVSSTPRDCHQVAYIIGGPERKVSACMARSRARSAASSMAASWLSRTSDVTDTSNS